MASSFDKLQKFIRLEIERKYDNRAVVGGLDKILPIWENEARQNGISEDLVAQISEKLTSYPGLDQAGRTGALEAVLELISSYSASTPTPESPQSGPITPTRQRHYDDYRPEDSQYVPRQKSSEKPVGLTAPLTVIQGVGPHGAKDLESLGLKTLEDLMYYFPRRYDDYSQMKPINRIEYGEEITVIGMVKSIFARSLPENKKHITEVVITDGTAPLRIVWFNQPWIETKIHEGDQLVVSGKIDIRLGRLQMNSPDWEFVDQDHLHTNRIVPVYSLNAQVKQKSLRRMIYSTVNFWSPRLVDPIPEWIRTEAELVPLSTALKHIHFPDSQDMLNTAINRLSFDEIFYLQIGVLQQKQQWRQATARIYEIDDKTLDDWYKSLPFPLTQAQTNAITDIRADLQSGLPMNRLLQGDVGSGKTIVAALSVAVITQNQAQASVMAPTSILAEQHYRSFTSLLASSEGDSLLKPEEIRLLVGATPESERKVILEELSQGKIKLLIGTHALIEDPVVFKDLQLVVVDEQHRFGVQQRALLRNKGENPHLLVMTATPIPRSLALTVYGDLDLSLMDEMPAGRIPVETHVLRPVERERAFQLIRTQVSEGHQAFVIYPLIEKGEKEEARAAVEDHEHLQNEIFPHLKVGLLHGRMRPDEKDETMAAFRDKKFDILVSTTVIEVGVDVPNATVMVIEGAERFGLAQLHQLRGRVGRGSDKSYCLLIPQTEDQIENQRLEVMEQTNDGFVLAEKDLEQRGPGDFLGTRQSGYAQLKLADLMDVRLIEKARHFAQEIFKQDPSMEKPEHALINDALKRYWNSESGEGDIS
jgi:ATP-dependent DNA helicase RecG